MKGEALSSMKALVKRLRGAADRDDRHAFLDARAELERFICERSFSPRMAHLLEVMAFPSARYRVFHVSVPGYMAEVARCYEGVYEAFSKKDEIAAERSRLRVMELGRELLRRYFIEPYVALREQEQTTDQL
jgi:DNA-binding GntR family transcriptional regulator